MSHRTPELPAPWEVFEDPVVQLAALCPFCALAALSPTAALAALSPALRIFNPAINPNAARLAFFSLSHSQVNRVVHQRLRSHLSILLAAALLRRLIR